MDKRLRELLSVKDIPKSWQPRYVLSRINGKDIQINWQTRDAILQAMDKGMKYVFIRDEIIVTISSIQSIDPFWGEPNIPPAPKPSNYEYEFDEKRKVAYAVKTKDEEYVLWESIFGELCRSLPEDIQKRLTDSYGTES